MSSSSTIDCTMFLGPPERHSLCDDPDDPRGFAVLVYTLTAQQVDKMQAVVARMHEGNMLVEHRGKMFGREFLMPRKMALFATVKGLKYEFSNNTMCARDVAEVEDLQDLFDTANVLREPGETPFRAVLVNRYSKPGDKVDLHSDKDVSKDEKTGVVAFSFGGTRTMRFVANTGTKGLVQKTDVKIHGGQAYIMYGKGFQVMQACRCHAGGAN